VCLPERKNSKKASFWRGRGGGGEKRGAHLKLNERRCRKKKKKKGSTPDKKKKKEKARVTRGEKDSLPSQDGNNSGTGKTKTSKVRSKKKKQRMRIERWKGTRKLSSLPRETEVCTRIGQIKSGRKERGNGGNRKTHKGRQKSPKQRGKSE